jgi:apolipoprotein N-acyltransferase
MARKVFMRCVSFQHPLTPLGEDASKLSGRATLRGTSVSPGGAPPFVTILSPVRGQLAVLQVPATAKALTFFHRLLLAIASGVALTLAYPRWNLSLMVWLWIFPLLYALWGGRAKSEVRSEKSEVRRGFALGYLAGVAFFIPNIAWVRHSSRVIAGAEDNSWAGMGPEIMGVAAVLGLGLYLALYFGVWAAFAATIGRPRISGDGMPAAGDAGRLFSSSLESLRSAGLTAGAWVACEWLRGMIFTGFGWNGLGVALHQNVVLRTWCSSSRRTSWA